LSASRRVIRHIDFVTGIPGIGARADPSALLLCLGRIMARALDSCAVRILVCLYAIEAAVLLIFIGIYKAPAWDSAPIATRAGVMTASGLLCLVVAGWLLREQIKLSGPLRGRAAAIALTTNLLSVVITFGLLETTLRVVSRQTDQGLVVGAVRIQPTWRELVAQSGKFFAGSTPWGTWDTSYFVYDGELGWTVGSNRQSRNGLYFSSVEGTRSPGPNVRIADSKARYRVALIGDSNAFSFEVPYEDSWGYHLQQLLGKDVQVLNFGVDGYGLDQAYLRYSRDVRPWHPQVVLVAFVQHDFTRAMAVYPFVSFGWPGYLVKPRFILEKNKLKLLNVPLPTPTEILGMKRIEQLPYVEYDLGFATTDWSWRFNHAPLLFRFLTSALPRWVVPPASVAEEAMTELNSSLFGEIFRSIQQAGSVPLLVYMSGSKDRLVRETLATARVPYLDMTRCVAEVPARHRRVPSGHHYTGVANQAIARCTAPTVQHELMKFAAGKGNAGPYISSASSAPGAD
jgi:hypothetical protein